MTLSKAIRRLKKGGDFSACIARPGNAYGIWLRHSYSYKAGGRLHGVYATATCIRQEGLNHQLRQITTYPFTCTDFLAEDWEIVGHGDTNKEVFPNL